MASNKLLKHISTKNFSFMSLFSAVCLSGMLVGNNEVISSFLGVGFCVGVYFTARNLQRLLVQGKTDEEH